jgi:MFS family permease
MGKLGEGAAPGTVRAAVFATLFTLVLHMLGTMASAIPAVLAPVAAGVFGVHPSRVGFFIAWVFIIGMPVALACSAVIARYGATRCAQIIAGCAALALLLMGLAGYGAQSAAATGVHVEALFIGILFLAATILGVGLGLINPLSSMVLFHASPANLRSFFFSIKQTAVPAGYATAGLVIPSLLLVMPWPWALFALSVVATVFMLSIFGMHVRVPPPAGPALSPSLAKRRGWRGFLEPVRTVWKSPPLLEMGLVSMLYSANQLVMSSFLVSYLNLELGMSLVAAGAMFATAQVSGIVGRIVWGLAADLWVPPRVQLGLLGVAGGLCGVVVSLFSPEWPHGLMLVVCALFGITAVGWNGVYLAETARLAGKRDIGVITAGVSVYNSLGALGGPALFALLVSVSHTYAPGYAIFAMGPLLLGLKMLLLQPPRNPAPEVR